MLLYYQGNCTTKPNLKMLKGKYKGLLRLRTGDIRIIFKMDGIKLIILVLDIVKRKDAYK